MNLRQRDPRQHDELHLKFVRQQPCCLPFCKREAEPAHLRMANLAIGKEAAGKHEKPHDKFTVPLCPYHHRIGIDCQHNSNESEWWARTGLNPWEIAAGLWIESGGSARALEPPKPKRVKRTAPRRPVDQRRGMQSRGFDSGLRRKFDGSVERRT